ncbi:MAG: SMC family ATPase, partial [Acidobacteria bacterium]
GASQHYLWSLEGNGRQECLARGKDVPKYIEKMLGVDYENFTRIFILEQGNFQKFLHSSPTEKAQLLGKLLNLPYLEKLPTIVSGLIQEKSAAIQHKRSEVERLKADTSQEKEQEIQSRIDQYLQLSQEIEGKLREVDRKLEEMSAMRNDWEELKRIKAELDRLSQKEETYKKKREEIALMKKIKQNIAGIFGQLKGYEGQIAEIGAQIRQKEAEIALLSSQIEETTARLSELEVYWKEKEAHYKKLTQLDDLLNYISLRRQVEDMRSQIQNLQAYLRNIDERISKIEEEKRTWDKQRAELEEEQKYLALEWLEWCKQREDLQKEIKKLEEEIAGAFQQLRKSRERILAQIRACPGIEGIFPLDIPENENKETWEAWKTQVRDLENRLKNDIEQKKAQLKLHQQLALLRPSLRVGDPCPICKTPLSKVHLDSLSTEPDLEEIKSLEKFYETIQKVREAFSGIDTYIDLIRSKKAALKGKNNDLQEHLKKFCWGGEKEMQMTYDELSRKRKENERMLHEIKESILKINTEMEKIAHQKRKYEEDLSNREKQIHNREGVISEIHKKLPPEWLDKDEKWAEEEKHRLEESRRKAEEYEKLSEKKNQQEIALHRAKSAKEELDKQRRNLEEDAQKVQNKMRAEAEKLGANLDFVREVCESDEDLDKEEKEVEKFFELLDRYIQREKDLTPKVSSYNEEEHKKLEQDKAEYFSHLQKYHQELGRARQEQEWLKQNRERLVQLEGELKELLEEYQNLKELAELLDRKGFSQYVLRSFLDQVLRKANEYLLRWTGGMWELATLEEGSPEKPEEEKEAEASPSLKQKEIGKKELEPAPSVNQLEIIVLDRFARKAVKRKVSTLSGGQTFQASLALALALADHVRKRFLSRRLPGFFLIDEGFGSLDADSLHTVVHTLGQAAKDTRSAIGVITHREELKEYLDAYLHVQLESDSKLGKTSRVLPSWKERLL